MSQSPYDIPLQRLDGSGATVAEHAGKVLLIVNVASACGLTPQYAGLEKANSPGPDGAADIRWNFGKFLVGRDGRVVARFDPKQTPESLVPEVEAALA